MDGSQERIGVAQHRFGRSLVPTEGPKCRADDTTSLVCLKHRLNIVCVSADIHLDVRCLRCTCGDGNPRDLRCTRQDTRTHKAHR